MDIMTSLEPLMRDLASVISSWAPKTQPGIILTTEKLGLASAMKFSVASNARTLEAL
jgi:hypothetical protein